VEIPTGYEPYSRTATFTEDTIPHALLKAHTTKPGAWALIHVLKGRLIYRIVDERLQPSGQVLRPDAPPGVIEPTMLHYVRPLGPVAFYVEFFRAPQLAVGSHKFG
jgi:tellurite resistance-related uncharacterized protein